MASAPPSGTQYTIGSGDQRAVVVEVGAPPSLRLPGTAVDAVVRTVPGERARMVDSRKLPVGASRVAGTDLDFTVGRRIGQLTLDTTFGSVGSGGPVGSGGSAVRL